MFPFARHAGTWFFRRLAKAFVSIFVPLAIAAVVTFVSLDANVRENMAERESIKTLNTFVDVATSAIGFRDALISGRDVDGAKRRVDAALKKTMDVEQRDDPTLRAAWKKVAVSWEYARRGRRLTQANHIVDLTTQALAVATDTKELPAEADSSISMLSTITLNDIPILRGQIHLVSATLINTLRTRALTFKERVKTATTLAQSQSRVASLTDNYAMVGRSNRSVLNATSNNIRSLHDALDPLIATLNDTVESDRFIRADGRQADKIQEQFSHADNELTNLYARTGDEINGLLQQRFNMFMRVRMYARIGFLIAVIAGLRVLYIYAQWQRPEAESRLREEAEQKKHEAEKIARQTAEQALRATTAFREIVMERAPVGIATVDTDGRIFEGNRYLKRFFGNNDVSVIGSHRDRFLQFLKSEEESFNFERSFTSLEGRVRWADITVSRIYQDGTPLALCMLRDITERKDVELRLNYEATHDGLTKLANRNLFRSELGKMIARSRETGETFAVLFIDLDLFKYVNDTYGHAAGDFVLITASNRLQSVVGEHDLVARFGGDEFAVMIAAPTDLSVAERISQEIVTSLAEPIMWGEEIVNIGSSIGLAIGPGGAQNAEELMRNADTAMYAAKQMGRGRYVIFDPKMQESAHQSAQLANDLQTALQDQAQIHLMYEPIVSLDNNEIKGFEVLTRWIHPVYGEIPREEFIKVAEKSGAIRRLGRYVMREACLRFMELSERVPVASQYWLSVNISPSELATPNFVESMVDVINSTQFDPRRLYLEITENVMIVSGDQANRIMSRLRDLGIRISIDDFGAGYSSLRYLQELNIDLLKVDRGFLRDNPGDDSGRSILRAIVNLAAGFELPVVAEGVVTTEQLQLVTAIGCQYAQGEVWGKAMSIDEIESRHTGRPSKSSNENLL